MGSRADEKVLEISVGAAFSVTDMDISSCIVQLGIYESWRKIEKLTTI